MLSQILLSLGISDNWLHSTRGILLVWLVFFFFKKLLCVHLVLKLLVCSEFSLYVRSQQEEILDGDKSHYNGIIMNNNEQEPNIR